MVLFLFQKTHTTTYIFPWEGCTVHTANALLFATIKPVSAVAAYHTGAGLRANNGSPSCGLLSIHLPQAWPGG